MFLRLMLDFLIDQLFQSQSLNLQSFSIFYQINLMKCCAKPQGIMVGDYTFLTLKRPKYPVSMVTTPKYLKQFLYMLPAKRGEICHCYSAFPKQAKYVICTVYTREGQFFSINMVPIKKS